MAAPSNIREVSGPVPGLLDPTQPERLLRLPGSRFHFASFDPLTATTRQGPADLRKLPINDESCRPRRIVVEIAPSGDSFWRYVPNARLEDGVESEGQWPRAVNVCGEVIQCSQDQWDIYKLDPLYECVVRVQPYLAQITRKTNIKTAQQNAQRKRRASSLSPDRSTTVPSRTKRMYKGAGSSVTEVNENAKEESANGVEEMIVDSLPQANNIAPAFQQTFMLGKRCTERPSLSSTGQWQGNAGCSGPTPEDTKDAKKRKRPDIPESPLAPSESERAELQERRKRPRMNEKKDARRKELKRKRKEEGWFIRRREKGDEFLRTLITETTRQMQEQCKTESESTQPVEDGEQARQATIEESRRKLAELEADKPLWEAAARQRMKREEQEEKSIRVKARTREREDAECKARILREAKEKKKKEEEERLRREEAAGKERERRRRQQQRWAFGPWTTQRALERYKNLSEEFDCTKFGADLPLTMEAVPWPVLIPPARINVADVDWEGVEKFFARVREYMKPQDYKTFVEKSHRRFHPDRWRSRSLLKSVLDEAERDNMEVAANTVAQALTPLWRELTGR